MSHGFVLTFNNTKGRGKIVLLPIGFCC